MEQLLPTQDRPLSSTKEAIQKRYNERYSIYIATADTVIPNGSTPEIAAELVKKEFYQ